jgi:hypothetical protein
MVKNTENTLPSPEPEVKRNQYYLTVRKVGYWPTQEIDHEALEMHVT